jgi:hypothetical protein
VEAVVLLVHHLTERRVLLAAAVRLNLDVSLVLMLIDLQADEWCLR